MNIISKLKSMTPAARKAERDAREQKFYQDFFEDLQALKNNGKMTVNTNKKNGTIIYSITDGNTRLILTHITLTDEYTLRIKNNRNTFRNIDGEFINHGNLAHIAFDLISDKVKLTQQHIYILRNILGAIKSSNQGIQYRTGNLGFTNANKDYFMLYILDDKKIEIRAFHTAPSFLPYVSGFSNETYELRINDHTEHSSDIFPKNYRGYNTPFAQYVFDTMASIYDKQQKRNGR